MLARHGRTVQEPDQRRGGRACMRRHLQRAWPGFDGARFEALAGHGLESLELKARAQHLCAALEATLPADFEAAAAVIEASLAPTPATRTCRRCAPATTAWPAGSCGRWRSSSPAAAWPRPSVRCRCCMRSTQRFTAEWAMRPFIVRAPRAGLRDAAALGARRRARTCAAWPAKAAARACPGALQLQGR